MKNHSKFQLIFSSVIALTLTSGTGAVYLAQQPHLTPQQERLFDTAITLCTASSTATIGLLGTHDDEDD